MIFLQEIQGPPQLKSNQWKRRNVRVHGIEIRRVTDQAHIEEIDQISRFLIEMLLGQLVQEDCTQIDIEDIESLHDPQTARAK